MIRPKHTSFLRSLQDIQPDKFLGIAVDVGVDLRGRGGSLVSAGSAIYRAISFAGLCGFGQWWTIVSQ